MFINYKRLLSYKRFQPPQIRLPSLSIKQSSLIIPKIDIKQIYYDTDTDTTKSENKINYNISTSSSFVEINPKNNLTYFYMITLLGLGILYIYNRHGNKYIKFI
jgi:hypothetical protein